MNQIGLEGMPEPLFSCSPSQLNTWLDCPRRFRLQYLEKKPAGFSWAHNSLGSSAHIALRDWFDLDITDRTPEVGAKLVERAWVRDGYKDDEQSEAWKRRVSDMVQSYLTEIDPSLEPIARERQVAFTSDAISMAGKVDRVDIEVDDSGEHAVVVDYKTSKSVLTDDDARTSLALAMYVLGVRRTLKRRSYRVELHHLPTQRVLSFEHTDESLTRHLSRADSIGREASAATAVFKKLDPAIRNGEADAIDQVDVVFPARPSTMCGWCDVRRWCSIGQEAAAAKQPWDGLATELAAPDIEG